MSVKIDQIINSVYNSVTYLITSNTDNLLYLIDCGDAQPVLDYIKRNRLSLNKIFLTHTHFDHIYGLNEIIEKNPNCLVYTNSNGMLSLYDAKFNMSHYQIKSASFIYKYQNVRLLDEGDNLNLGQSSLQVFSTCGHDWSCLSYKIDNYLFTGDSYIPNSKLIFHFPKSNKIEAIKQLKRLKGYELRYSLTVMPGHKI